MRGVYQIRRQSIKAAALLSGPRHSQSPLKPEFFAQIEAADLRVVDDVVGAALHQHLAE